MTIRPNVRKEFIDSAMESADEHMQRALIKHGRGAYSSRHEILGTVAEEYFELIEAVKSAAISGAKNTVREELLDIAVVCLFGVASIDAGAIEGKKTEEQAA